MKKMAVFRGERWLFARETERLDTESQVRGKSSRRSKKETAPLGTASWNEVGSMRDYSPQTIVVTVV